MRLFLDVCVFIFYHSVVAMRLGGVRGKSNKTHKWLKAIIISAQWQRLGVMVVQCAFSPEGAG